VKILGSKNKSNEQKNANVSLCSCWCVGDL